MFYKSYLYWVYLSLTEKTLETYVWLPFNTNIFNFLDYLAAGNFSRAFKLLEEEFAKDDRLLIFFIFFFDNF